MGKKIVAENVSISKLELDAFFVLRNVIPALKFETEHVNRISLWLLRNAGHSSVSEVKFLN